MRIELGWVAMLDGKPHTGHAYTAGAKVYKTENMARAALKFYKEQNIYTFVKAYAEIPGPGTTYEDFQKFLNEN